MTPPRSVASSSSSTCGYRESISDLRRYVELVDAGEVTVPERLDMLLERRDILRSQIGQLQLALAATEYKIATYKGAPQS